MSKKEVLAIAIKVFSLWFLCQLFIQALAFSPALLSLANWQNNQIPAWVYFIFPACFILSGVIIALLLSRIANSALSTLSEQDDIALSQTNQRFILQVVGLFFIVNALTYLPGSISFLISTSEIKLSYFLRPFGYIFQFTIGLWLAINSSWWALLFNRLRGRA